MYKIQGNHKESEMAITTRKFSSFTALLYVCLLSIVGCLSAVNGQHTAGVSLQLHGVTIPNNSLIDVGDLLYRTRWDPSPVNSNGLHNRTLVCITDLEDCCDSPRTVRGDWYYPDGRRVEAPGAVPRGITFLRNRGPNEVINGHHYHGSVRLFYRWSRPPGKGRFRCELPSASNPNVNQILYANIVDFGISYSLEPVILSSAGSGIAGESYSLICSATLVDPVPLPSNIPTPTIEWFFGPNGNAPLPSGVTPTATTLGSGYTYTSSLQFSPLTQCHTGMYTCQLGVGTLANSTMITANASGNISVQITTSGSSVLGESGFTLTCCVSGADNLNPFIGYQWTKDNGTRTQIQDGPDPRTVSFAPLRVSDVGRYTCQATISSPDLNHLVRSGSQDVMVTIPAPLFVILSPPHPGIIQHIGSAITMTCNVELSPVVNVPVNVTTVWTGPAGFMTTNTAQPIVGSTTNYTSTAVVGSFGRNESGVYSCSATATTTSPFLRDSASRNGTARITVGVYLSLNRTVYANNSIIYNINIGETDPYTSQNEGLQCITDRMPCCETEPNNSGEWYFPNGTTVLAQGSTMPYYRNKGDDGAVNLNRINSDAISPTGLFCCVMRDATDTLQRVCATIISIQINGNVPTSPTVGQNYTLTCHVHGTDSDVIAYQWMKDGNLLSNEMQAALSFSSIMVSDAGQYTCEVTVESMKYSAVEEIILTIPSPTSVSITSVPHSPIRPVGSAVGVTCTVGLSPTVDVPVTVTISWTGPAGFMTNNTAQSVMGNTTIRFYASTVTVDSFERDQSGIYTCSATIISASLNPFIRDSITSSSTRVTVGVYVSFNGTVYSDKSVVQITEIGETDPYTGQGGGVQCITDRKPCCRDDQFSVGEWLFPNGSSIPTQQSAAVYYRNRGNDGSVSLNILISDTPLPLLTGLFCCVVPDATDTMQTACVDIKLTFSTEISSTGTTVAGQSYTLHCNVFGIENFSPILSYKWTKNNGTLTNVGSDSNILSFSPLRLSDAGQYICHVTASSDVTNEHVANASSQSFEVNISVPEHTVSLHSNSPKLTPILSESSFTLTCTVELNPAVDVPVTVSTVWTGPDGAIITSATRPEKKSFTLYASVNTLHSVDSADSGNYTCTASIENGVSEVSASTNITIVDGLFQLRLMSADICQKWYSEDSDKSEHYSHFIKEALIEAIEYQCKCHFPSTNLLKRDIFICGKDSPNRMTYRNMLLGTHNFNGEQIVGFIQNWVSSGPLIKLGGNYVQIDNDCPVAISSMYESMCEQEQVCVYDNKSIQTMCAQHLTNKNTNVTTCI